MIFNLSAGDNTSEEVAILLTEFMSEVNDTLTSFKSEINTMLTGFTNGIDADMTALSSAVNTSVSTLSTTVNGIPKGAVKSVQRGTVAGTPNNSTEITISTVNPNKCLVLLGVNELGGNGYNYLPTVYSLTATKLTITQTYISFTSENKTTNISWQVIEFY